MAVIQIEGLEFGYHKKQTVLKDVFMNVPAGSIYGFLGANGAGKTTTIRIILGLLKARSGQLLRFGTEAQKTEQLKRIGSLIEAPSIYQHLSARQNLQLVARYRGVPRQRIGELLELCGIADTGRKGSGKFSTGMKQRLGLAIALLHDPELLILDEPTNGLDPNGISDIRRLLLRLKEQGKTIILSSHILPEIQKIASRIGILRDGRMMFEGSLDELETSSFSQSPILIRCSNPDAALTYFSSLAKLSEENAVILPPMKKEGVGAAIKKLVENGHDVYEVSRQSSALEDWFLNVNETQSS